MQAIQDKPTACPAVQSTQGRHPAVVRYRLFSKSRLDSKVFGPTQKGRQAMADFLRDMGAKAKRVIAKQMIANWKAMKAAGTA